LDPGQQVGLVDELLVDGELLLFLDVGPHLLLHLLDF
jgi:hypothetical protein